MLEKAFAHMRAAIWGASDQRDLARQLIAGTLGSVVFLGLHLALDFIWPVAFALSVAGYFGVLRALEQAGSEPEHIASTDSKSELAGAAIALQDFGNRLRKAADEAPGSLNNAIDDMSDNVLSIREILLESPTDFRSVKSFINVFLPRIVETVETYVRLSGQTSGAAAERLDVLSAHIAAFSPTIGRIKAACLESDLRTLEIEVTVLSERFPENG